MNRKQNAFNEILSFTVGELIIAALTFIICLGGVKIGQKMGTKLSSKAGILGGCGLIFLGLKIFVTNIIFA